MNWRHAMFDQQFFVVLFYNNISVIWSRFWMTKIKQPTMQICKSANSQRLCIKAKNMSQKKKKNIIFIIAEIGATTNYCLWFSGIILMYFSETATVWLRRKKVNLLLLFFFSFGRHLHCRNWLVVTAEITILLKNNFGILNFSSTNMLLAHHWLVHLILMCQ